MWTFVVERFEQHAPAGVMARLALEHALPAGPVEAVFEEHRQRQYSRALLFSTVVELTTLASLGLRPSLHAAACQMPALPVRLTALYDEVNHTEPGILRALVRGSAERLAPVAAAVGGGTTLPGWRLRVLDANHLPASEKRLAPLRGSVAGAGGGGLRSARRPGSPTWWPARMPAKASAPWRPRCWPARSRGSYRLAPFTDLGRVFPPWRSLALA